MTNKKDDIKTEDIIISDKKQSKNFYTHALKELFSYLFKQKWQLIVVLILSLIHI